jgi:hypothetical protein
LGVDAATAEEVATLAPARDEKAVLAAFCLTEWWRCRGRRPEAVRSAGSGDSIDLSGGRSCELLFWARRTEQGTSGCGRPARGGAAKWRLGGGGDGGDGGDGGKKARRTSRRATRRRRRPIR